MKKVSKKTINRALLYIRILKGLIKEKKHLISSRQLAEIAGLTDVQVRKDISHFGKVGTPRIGYKTLDLINTLEDFILQKEVVKIVLFGVGNLGSAILKYPGFQKDRIRIVAAFDRNKKKAGKKVNQVSVYHFDRAADIIQKSKATVGIIAVPQEAAQEVADSMVLSGLKGIVNFAPISLTVPEDVCARDMDFTIEFLSLFCEIQAVNDYKK